MWKNAADQLKASMAKPPPGCQDLADIAAELGVGEESAREMVKQLIKAGRAEPVSGKRIDARHQLVNATYYRLIKPAKAQK